MATFGRLLGFLRPYRSGVLWSGLLAVAALTMTAAIPWLTGRAIDQMRDGDRGGLRTLAFAVLGAGVLRMALTVARRLIAGRVSLGVELDLRTRMYGHLQSLELAFFDRQQTGQLMSRSTVDLQSVRFFLGYGLIFMLQSGLTIVLAAVAMFLTEPGLAMISLAPVPFVVAIAARYGRRSRPALQEVQQRIAELTADVEENVSGVRVVKAFAREDRQLERFRGQVGRVFDQSMVTTPDGGVLQPVHRLPAAGRPRRDPVLRRPPGHPRRPHHRAVQRLLHLPADAAVADADARHLAEPRPARDGRRRPPVPDPRP
jgi:ATP-binding cassette subfamily B protein